MPRLSIDELTRLAFYYAEQDRASLADSYSHMPNDREAKRAKSLARQFRAYRLKRWGKTVNDCLGDIEEVSDIDIARGAEE